LGDVATAERRISKTQAERVGRLAFDIALARYNARLSKYHKSAFISPPKVTIVHKANVLPITDGLFRDTILSLKQPAESGSNSDTQRLTTTPLNKPKDYHKILVEEQLVDSLMYRLFKEPELFDVIVAPNMYGDVIRFV
jgi:homoisocitrate dehydrogenase